MVRTDARPRGLRLQNEDTRLGSSCESKFAGEQPSIASAMSMPTIGVRGSEERASCGRTLRQGHNRMAQTAVKAKHGAYGPQRHELGQPAIESQGSVAAKIRHMESATALARVLCLLQPRRVVAQYRKPMEHMLCYCRQRAEAKDRQNEACDKDCGGIYSRGQEQRRWITRILRSGCRTQRSAPRGRSRPQVRAIRM